ncbi:MAG: ABC transporter substrate-binding protein [Deltaproteobacteria bacterium]|nr:ABC transporter substrate-binding protein [Deltaproteobacteria bacterium]
MKRVCLLVSACLILGAVACGKKGPILIGVVGDLESEQHGGDSGFRNGVFLGIEAVNDRGGIDGRPLQALTGNDQGDPDTVARVDEKLVASGAVALLGHNTSATTAAALPVIARHRILLMGPEATSSEFAGKKDFFVRDEVREQAFADALAEYAVKTMKLSSVGALIDAKNRPFTKPFFEAFQKKMKALGSEAEPLYLYEVLDTVEAGRQVDAFLSRGGQAVLLVTNGADTRNLAQMVRRVRDDVPLLGTPWAIPPAVGMGGAVPPEDLVLPLTWDPDSRSPAYLEFKKTYEQRFSHPVDYHAVHAYEAVQILAKGLEEAGGKAERLPQAIAKTAQFEGLQGPIQIDPYGDAERTIYISRVVGGRLHRVWPPAK